MALISLTVALSSLAYNTWRNEQSEDNRNVRAAGFQILLKLGELDRVVFFRHYDNDKIRGNPRAGWAYVLTIKDLGALANEPAMSSSIALADTWEENWSGLGKDDESVQAISASIERLRSDTHTVLSALE